MSPSSFSRAVATNHICVGRRLSRAQVWRGEGYRRSKPNGRGQPSNENVDRNVQWEESIVADLQGSPAIEDGGMAAEPSSNASASDRSQAAVDVDTHRVESLRRADTESQERKAMQVEELKRDLLAATAGLDRGLSATKAQADQVEAVVEALEGVAGSLVLSWVASGRVRSSMEELGGVWRLIYSSAFLSGSFGGSRPGPQSGRVPFNLGPIYQRIDCNRNLLDNVVELMFRSPLPFLPDLPSLRACLRHTFEVKRERGVEIVYDSTSADVLNGEQVAQVMGVSLHFEPPALQRMAPKELRSASFDVTFLDKEMRVTRGDRGELRIYVRDNSALGGSQLPDPDASTTFSSESD